MELKSQIIEATIEEFSLKGHKFTMDDIAKRLGMSKKTLYKCFADKETLLFYTIDHCFTAIQKSKNEILQNDHLSITEKLRKVLIVLPEPYRNIDWRQIHLAKDKYPMLYKEIEKRLETDWDPTIELLERGIHEGLLRPISIPVFKLMIQSSIEHFLNSNELITQNITYDTALDQLVSILLDGICTNTN